jgi:hypothetical protein
VPSPGIPEEDLEAELEALRRWSGGQRTEVANCGAPAQGHNAAVNNDYGLSHARRKETKGQLGDDTSFVKNLQYGYTAGMSASGRTCPALAHMIP